MSDQKPEITPQLLLRAYMAGIFPMAEESDSNDIFWCDPPMRGILPLEAFHVPRSLQKRMRKGNFSCYVNRNFAGVIARCGEATPDRPNSWINPQIRDLYTKLHSMGFAHSIEYYEKDELLGGLYGVSIGGAFFGESMFSRVTDASKIALVCLVGLLRLHHFTLLDTQFITSHLQRFGTIEVPRQRYLQLLQRALWQENIHQSSGLSCSFSAGLADSATGLLDCTALLLSSVQEISHTS
ncbi:MAG: leucyl/phenylalanyl-tRNA--protein transferase [Alphaproteobacteria bacterium]